MDAMNQPVEHTLHAVTPASGALLGAPFPACSEHTAHAQAEHLLDEYLTLTFPASDPVSPGFIT
jgi:hypothetical protein